MQVAIAREYFPAYARLPRKAQKKADELLRKFTLDPRQASLHYEPIHGAHDRQLRSLRVGDDYRAIVRAPETGEVFVLLWIDHHDEAYRWAESKRVEVHPATGTLQLFDVAAATQAIDAIEAFPREVPEVVAATERQGLFAALTDDTIFHGGVPRVLIPAVRAVATQDDLDQLLPHLPADAAEILTGLAAGYTLDVLLEEFVGRSTPTGTEKAAPRPDVADVGAALARPATQQQFRVVDADFDLESALAHPLDTWRVFLHPRQRALARTRAKGPLRVTGGAGTGKTVVALHRAAFLVREVYAKPDDRVLFTTFNVNLAHDVRRQLEKLLEPMELARIDVKNIDAIASEVLRNRGEPVRLGVGEAVRRAWSGALDVYGVAGFTPSFCMAEWRDVIQAQDLTDEEDYVRAVRLHRGTPLGRRERRLLWPLFRAFREELATLGLSEPVEVLRRARKALEADTSAPGYRAVVVDETQDFSLEALRLVRALAGPEHPDDLFLVGDAHQRIYGRPTRLGAAGIQIRGRRSQELRLNYRTTAAISRYSMGALGEEVVDDLDDGVASRRGYVSLRAGNTPAVQGFDDGLTEVAFVVAEVQRLVARGTPLEGICITARRQKTLKDRFLEALHDVGIAADLLEREEPRHASVRLATMHRIKGLEFPVVFVVALDEDEMPYRSEESDASDPVLARQDELAERCLLYVATSRARDALYVSYVGTPSPFLSGMRVGVAARRKEPTTLPPAPPTPPALAAASSPDKSEPPRSEAASEDDAPIATVADDDILLESLDLPARLATWASRQGITTLRGLARVTPAEMGAARNLGRTSIADARRLIESMLGARWEDIAHEQRQLLLGEPSAPTRWNALRVTLSDAVRASALDELELPARVRSYASAQGFKTVGDLAERSEGELQAAPNMSRLSIQRLFEAVRDQPMRLEMQGALAATGLLRSWKALLLEQDPVARMVLTRRAGLGGPVETLQSIAEIVGVTRERIRQIESRAYENLRRSGPWLREIHARFESALAGGAARLDDLATIDWWSEIVALPDALDTFGDRMLDGAARVIEIDQRAYLARCTQEAFDGAWRDVRTAAPEVALPCSLAVFQTLVESRLGTLGPVLVEAAMDSLRGLLRTESSTEGDRVLGFGTTHGAGILALLRASPTPVEIEDLWAQVGRGKLPEEVLLLGPALVGVEQHFPDYAGWMERLVPAAIELMEREGPERQWLAHALREDLAEPMEIPDWLTAAHLASLLRRSGRVTYLGRLRVALLDRDDDQARILYHEELRRLLLTRGGPMGRDELLGALRSRMTVREVTFAGLLLRPQFLHCDDERIGLTERDLPGGTEALAMALEHMAGVMERRQRGFGRGQVLAEIAALSPAHGRWTMPMCLSVLRGDARFRLSTAGGIGLATWEDVRVPSRTDLFRECLEESSGRLTVESVQKRIEEIYGDCPSRVGVGAIANRHGAVLRGDGIERVLPG